MRYKQCKMRNNNCERTSWIPEKFAIVGKYLKLDEDDGWKVIEVYTFAREVEEVVARSRDYKKTRTASDV